jgi:uncharacterized coiled-coil DUF342 family protein
MMSVADERELDMQLGEEMAKVAELRKLLTQVRAERDMLRAFVQELLSKWSDPPAMDNHDMRGRHPK